MHTRLPGQQNNCHCNPVIQLQHILGVQSTNGPLNIYLSKHVFSIQLILYPATVDSAIFKLTVELGGLYIFVRPGISVELLLYQYCLRLNCKCEGGRNKYAR